MERQQFDMMIGRLDRILSELIESSTSGLDTFDRQTLKHHAEDMVGAGNKILENLQRKEFPTVTTHDDLERKGQELFESLLGRLRQYPDAKTFLVSNPTLPGWVKRVFDGDAHKWLWPSVNDETPNARCSVAKPTVTTSSPFTWPAETNELKARYGKNPVAGDEEYRVEDPANESSVTLQPIPAVTPCPPVVPVAQDEDGTIRKTTAGEETIGVTVDFEQEKADEFTRQVTESRPMAPSGPDEFAAIVRNFRERLTLPTNATTKDFLDASRRAGQPFQETAERCVRICQESGHTLLYEIEALATAIANGDVTFIS